MYSLTLLLPLLCAVAHEDEPVHPAFLVSKASVESVWKKGYEDGQKKRDVRKALSLTQRQIDSFHTGPLYKVGCAWSYLLHPRAQIYVSAHTAGKQYWSPADVDKAKADFDGYSDKEPRYIGFFVELNEMPQFAGAYATLSRRADPSNLSDVRAVLKVGDRIIQPKEQPGDLTVSKSDNINFFSIPTTTYVRGTTTATASAYGSGGYASATGYSSSSYAVTSYSTGSQKYSQYRGQFTVLFPLRDENGKPLIKPTDKEVELIVIKKSRELKATYKLADWSSALEK